VANIHIVNKMKKKQYILTAIGVVVGLIAGYAYYHYVGCASGTCAITSKPLNSTLYGGLMGGLLFNMFVTSPKKKDK
jgi:LytS/YehU family sensor histidine kinase